MSITHTLHFAGIRARSGGESQHAEVGRLAADFLDQRRVRVLPRSTVSLVDDHAHDGARVTSCIRQVVHERLGCAKEHSLLLPQHFALRGCHRALQMGDIFFWYAHDIMTGVDLLVHEGFGRSQEDNFA